ncbi:hypothetical protein EZV62_027221 [Acer yangbiense]|uniref:Retroviral polymerase SH3-like domain-containing protein n=1 Tax=Acer yangbiense TaxID=1000413 RepID=A0A5C7GTV7_9ROSI|nr:hypothetical protein EZV62_027221 [Acer yangbiense]
MEMWTGKPADYSNLHSFGCPMYIMYNAQERAKLDLKSRRCIFLGYADGVKGYCVWDPTTHKVIVSREVEDNPEQEDLDSSEAEPEHEVQESVEFEVLEVRRSTRERRPPAWHSESSYGLADTPFERNGSHMKLISLQLNSTFKELQGNNGYSSYSEISAAEMRKSELVAMKENMNKNLASNYEVREHLQNQLQNVLTAQNQDRRRL